MMARVIGGDQMGFNAMVYSQPDQRLLSYLQDSISNAGQKLQDTGTQFISNAMNMFDKYNSNAVINATKALVSTVDSHINPDVILNLNEETIFNAMPVMQQYVMVQPELWELNRNQMCDAYGGTYYDTEPNVTSYEDHTKYQEVMDGIMQFDDKTDESFFVSYSSSSINELHIMDQLSVLSSWDAAAKLIAEDIDPSSIDGNEL